MAEFVDVNSYFYQKSTQLAISPAKVDRFSWIMQDWDEPWSRKIANIKSIREETWFAERLWFAMTLLQDTVEIAPDVRGGMPVIRGTRIPVARILAEIADGYSIGDIAEDLDLDVTTLKNLIDGMAIKIDRSFTR